MRYKWSDINGQFKVVHTMKDGEGIRVMNKFLKSLVNDIAKNAYEQTIGNMLIPPFAFKERQLHTIIAPAINKNSDYFLMESPVKRNWKNVDINLKNNHGWVDYWTCYKEYDYYIEVKHGFRAYNSHKVRDCELKKWNKACCQLNTLTDEIEYQKDYCKGAFQIALHVMPVFIQSQDIKRLAEKKITSEGILESTSNQLSSEYNVNWSCIWILSDELDKVYEYTNGNERYPFVMFFARVYEIVK